MELIEVFYDKPIPGGKKYLNVCNIVSIEPLKRGWKDCTLIKDILGEEFYTMDDVETTKEKIEKLK